jgi:hypothetical protein
MNIKLNPIIVLFYKLCSDAATACEDIDVNLEPMFSTVLELVIAHPELRAEFAHGFVFVLGDYHRGPHHLVEYCMHELRWSEVYDSVLKLLAEERSERVRQILRSVLDAYSADWSGVGFYSRFSKP